MRKIIIILFLAITNISYSQLTTDGATLGEAISGIKSLGSYGLSTPDRVSAPVYNARAKLFFDRVTAKGKTLTDAQKSWYNDSIFVPLSDSGLIGTTRAGDSLAVLYSFSLKWAGDSTVANMNLLDTSYTAIHYGGVTYTDSGVVGNGSTGYLNTFFNPASDSTIYKLNSASFGVYSKTVGFINSVEMGIFDNTNISDLSTDFYESPAEFFGRINANTTLVKLASTGAGMHSVSRISNAQVLMTLNGTSALNSSASTALINLPFYIFARNTNGTAGQFSSRCLPFAFIGSGLSSTKATALSNTLNTALKGWKYNVY